MERLPFHIINKQQKMIEDLDEVYSNLERQETGFGYDSDE